MHHHTVEGPKGQSPPWRRRPVANSGSLRDALDWLDDDIARRIGTDRSIDHETAWHVMDHVSEAIQDARRRHNIPSPGEVLR